MTWTVRMVETFPLELAQCPKKVQKAYTKTVLKKLQSNPINHSDNAIKKLANWKTMYRYRIANQYRLVYEVDEQNSTIDLCMIGNRSKIYDRLGHDDNLGISAEVISDHSLHDLIENSPSADEIGRAITEVALTPRSAPSNRNDMLPFGLTEDHLDAWNIDKRYHKHIVKCEREEDLLNLESKGVSHGVVELLLNSIWPPILSEIENKPRRIAGSAEAMEKLVNGEVHLEEFMLALDETQKPFVNRFKGKNPVGPWLVKGGPGSGKSTVALYCIRELVHNDVSALPLGNEKIKILFTTYTRSLVNASKQLLDYLGARSEKVQIDVININKIATGYLGKEWDRFGILKPGLELKRVLEESIRSGDTDGRYFSENDTDFILDEIEQCIIGENIETFKQYKDHSRTGRGRALKEQQRLVMWEIFEKFQSKLRNLRKGLFIHQLKTAADNATGKYDYVFIDEAQDLKPVAIRLCTKLAKTSSNVFLTADLNQSIYGSGFSWKKIHGVLDFRGRAVNLKRNYRTTSEIWNAIMPIFTNIDGCDKETLDESPVKTGELPTLISADGIYAYEKVAEWLSSSLLSEKLPPSCAAILCPTNQMCTDYAQNLPAYLNAKAMKSFEVDVRHPGVKVMTLHAAKGLQFPVVAVVGLQEDRLPRKTRGGRDATEERNKQLRLFFVGCTRAMSRLLVVGSESMPSSFLNLLPEEAWDIEY